VSCGRSHDATAGDAADDHDLDASMDAAEHDGSSFDAGDPHRDSGDDAAIEADAADSPDGALDASNPLDASTPTTIRS